MAFSRWTAGTQYNLQNPNPPSGSNSSIYTHHNSYFPQHSTQNPNPNMSNPHNPLESQFPGGFDSTLRPPGIESYAHAPHVGYEALTYAHQTYAADTLAASSAYYQNINAQNWVNPLGYEAINNNPQTPQVSKRKLKSIIWNERRLEIERMQQEEDMQTLAKTQAPLPQSNIGFKMLKQMGYTPGSSLGKEGTGTAKPVGFEIKRSRAGIGRTEGEITEEARKNGTWKKTPKKVVPHVYCEICKLEMNSHDVYAHHILGKKHKRNLEIMNQQVNPAAPAPAPAPVPALTPTPTPTPTPAPAPAPVGSSESSNPAIGPQENPNKKKASKPVDLEAKKRKIVEGGVAVNEVRTCTICNVVCNSAAVFNSHIAGQKHAAKLKIYTATAGAAVIATTPS